jgi:Flp pilus assembly protein TadG
VREADRRTGRRRAVTRRTDAERGSVTLQYVILIPAMFALIFTCIQVSLYSFARSVALTAAEEGADAQRAYGAPGGVGLARAQAIIASQGDTLRNPQVTVAINGDEVVVTVTGRTQSVLPGFGGYQVTETASGPIEEFRP